MSGYKLTELSLEEPRIGLYAQCGLPAKPTMSLVQVSSAIKRSRGRTVSRIPGGCAPGAVGAGALRLGLGNLESGLCLTWTILALRPRRANERPRI